GVPSLVNPPKINSAPSIPTISCSASPTGKTSGDCVQFTPSSLNHTSFRRVVMSSISSVIPCCPPLSHSLPSNTATSCPCRGAHAALPFHWAKFSLSPAKEAWCNEDAQ